MRPLIAGFLLISVLSCKSTHRLSQEFDLRDNGERTSQTRYVATRSIDSVDISALKTDVWKLEHYSFPDSIRLFVRVLDSNGFVVTNMAAPYKKVCSIGPSCQETFFVAANRQRKRSFFCFVPDIFCIYCLYYSL